MSRTSDYWIYALGDLDTVGELLDSGGMSIDINDRGGALPNPDNFFLWQRLQSGTYFIRVTGYGPTDEPYILRVREFTDTTSRSNAATLNLNGSASGTIDPEDDDDYFKLELSETTEVAIRASGFPDTVGELQRSNGTVIASNDDGYLPGNRRNFVIRENLAAGVYYVKVSSFDERSDGPYSVYAAAITEPGSAIADAQPLTLGGTAGGIIDPAGDEDYFSLTLEETTYVIIGGVSKVTNISAALTDENDLAAPVNPVHSDDTFFFQGRLGDILLEGDRQGRLRHGTLHRQGYCGGERAKFTGPFTAGTWTAANPATTCPTLLRISLPSTRTLRLLPALARSVGLGPMASPQNALCPWRSPHCHQQSSQPSTSTAFRANTPTSTQRWKVRWMVLSSPNSLGKRFH